MGRVIWITGLSGAGKTTLADALATSFRETDPRVIVLDGDDLRRLFGTSGIGNESYAREDRRILAKQYGLLCSMLSQQGFTVIIATISMHSEVHAWNRENLPGYYEVYLKVPVEELKRRDAKKLYSRFYAGEIRNVAGLDLEVDEPINPDWLELFAQGRTVEIVAEELLKELLT